MSGWVPTSATSTVVAGANVGSELAPSPQLTAITARTEAIVNVLIVRWWCRRLIGQNLHVGLQSQNSRHCANLR